MSHQGSIVSGMVLPAGRADYYGSLPNLAARVAALAQPGQILVEGSSGFAESIRWNSQDHIGLLELEPTGSNTSEEEDIELQLLGFYLLKVHSSLCYVSFP